MPELPEVETIKNELSPWVTGQCFTEVTILDAKLISQGSIEQIRLGLIGQKIERLERRGKYLMFHLSNSKSLVMHLRMTGVLLLDPPVTDRYTRALFRLSNDRRLVFSDRRRLGVMWLAENTDALKSKLGPEPLDDSFTPHILKQKLSKHHIPVKLALINQGIIAGIGNMYADEALFDARIHPQRQANSLSAQEIETLFHCIRKVLREAIENQGASVDSYIRPDGKPGTAHFHFKVAHRKDAPCPVCGLPIERIELVRNRGTYFCPNCQPRYPRYLI